MRPHSLSLILLAAPAVAQEAPETPTQLHAGVLHTGAGEPVENALITLKDGKISAVLPGRDAPDGVLSAPAVTAGMIDLSVRILPGGERSVEQSSEVVTNLSVLDSLDVFDPRWARQARAGVTTVLASPEDRNVIGGFSVILKTAGQRDLEARMIEGRGVLRGAIGREPSAGNSPAFGQPSTFFNRRPTTRMGVEWEWRKAFFDAAAAAQYPEADFEGADVLRAVLAGDITLFVQAWTTQDIRTGIFLVEELARENFGDVRLVFDAGAEAWKEMKMLTRSSAAIVLPPFPDNGRTGDGAFMPANVALQLQENNVLFALSAHGDTSAARRLSMQAGLARRGGLSLEQALAAVTLNPARILGIEDRVGTVESGKDADLVLWSGTPFDPSSRVSGVLLGGELVLDPRD